MTNKVIIIGDSTHNTLSAVRSFGEAKIPQVLLLVCEHDTCYVQHSKYLKHDNCHVVDTLDECLPLLEELKQQEGQTLMTTFDAAAEWVDAREPELSKVFRTPCRGQQLGNLFNKDAQCRLAEECGLTVPFSLVYDRKDELPIDQLKFPLLTKPLVSSKGSKEDIHICKNMEELKAALAEDSHCEKFILQEFIEKEFELNCIGMRTDQECVLSGAIRKIRHWPRLTGAGSFAYFDKVDVYGVNEKGVAQFLKKAGYYGPFSVEFLHKDGKNYFMEVNLRNDGLAYTATAAGVNLHALYMREEKLLDWSKFHPVYMMNTSIDRLYVKEGDITNKQWWSDFKKTKAFINMNWKDMMPTYAYYCSKILRKFKRK